MQKKEIELKKQTLKVWTMILHKQGKIDTVKYNRMMPYLKSLRLELRRSREG